MMTTKWLRVMADYGACGLWKAPGIEADITHLPLSEALLVSFQAWSKLYPKVDAELEQTGDLQSDDGRKFIDMGLQLAHRLKKELPDYTIVYYDELKAQHASIEGKRLNRNLYEIEIA